MKKKQTIEKNWQTSVKMRQTNEKKVTESEKSNIKWQICEKQVKKSNKKNDKIVKKDTNL